MRFFPIALLALTFPAAASTWLDEGSVVAMDRALAAELVAAELCSGVPDDEALAVYDSGQTIFVLSKDGQVTALKNMFAERFWLDHCQ
jgi:hypothetical protein